MTEKLTKSDLATYLFIGIGLTGTNFLLLIGITNMPLILRLLSYGGLGCGILVINLIIKNQYMIWKESKRLRT